MWVMALLTGQGRKLTPFQPIAESFLGGAVKYTVLNTQLRFEMLWLYTRFGNFPPVVMDFVKGIMYLAEAEWLLLICTV